MNRGTTLHHATLALAGTLGLALAPAALAVDGGAAVTTEGDTYYEAVLGGAEPKAYATAGDGLPEALHAVDAEGSVEYRQVGVAADGDAVWEVTVEMAERPHERVDAVYDLVLALPLPVDADGRAAARPLQWGLAAKEGPEGDAVAFVYGGEKVVLKRNVGLERSWLPRLRGAEQGLPDLAGSGYGWTFWDAILRYDPGQGDTVQGRARLRYESPAWAAPDPGDARNAAHLITWIPTLDPSIPPYAIRLDVVAPQP